MSYFDFLKVLRKGEPDIRKAGKAMTIMGWVCVFAGLWNFTMYFLAMNTQNSFKLPPQYPYLALLFFIPVGILFFRSARGIREMEPAGKKTGQIAILMLLAAIFAFTFFIGLSETDLSSSMEFIIIGFFIIAQFALPAYFGIRYLARLPVRTNDSVSTDLSQKQETVFMANEVPGDYSSPRKNYKESLFPFGLFGTFALLFGAIFVLLFVVNQFSGSDRMIQLFLPVFLLFFFGSTAYNYIPSTFQTERNIVASSTGGGSIFFFNGTWPFLRLLLYADGIEMRVMFHRFFIPFDKLGPISQKVGFFSNGILLTSDLPGVPSNIRFYGFGMKSLVKTIIETRRQYQLMYNK